MSAAVPPPTSPPPTQVLSAPTQVSIVSDMVKHLVALLGKDLQSAYSELTDEDKARILRTAGTLGLLKVQRTLAPDGTDLAQLDADIAQAESTLAAYKSVAASIVRRLAPEAAKQVAGEVAGVLAVFGKELLKGLIPGAGLLNL